MSGLFGDLAGSVHLQVVDTFLMPGLFGDLAGLVPLQLRLVLVRGVNLFLFFCFFFAFFSL